MTRQDRFNLLMSLFEEAIALPAEARGDFVRERCAGDPDLERELVAMLAEDEAPRTAVGAPGGGARLLAEGLAAAEAPGPLDFDGLGEQDAGGEHPRRVESDAHPTGLEAGDHASRSGLGGASTDRPRGDTVAGANGRNGDSGGRAKEGTSRIDAAALAEKRDWREVPVLRGQYRMVRLIGEGGMGAVYEAEQSIPRRRVAIKMIRAGMASRRLLRRFEHEAHVLGRLQHPGIARLYEAGAAAPGAADQAFLVMEFIDGPPLTTYARQHQLGIRARLELFEQVCLAVAHAHQRGVIHRDLKPANILVDEQGQPKVLDFGVARVVDDDGEGPTQLTTLGQLVGTLAYMSPEQVSGDPAEIDVRTDVYALGVILYQLLADRLPLDVSSRSIPEAIRMIREEDPPLLGSIHRALAGDLETVAAKALEKDRTRRYQSALELAAEIRRALNGEPVEVRKGSTLYVLRRQIRRHRGPVAAACVIFVALIAFAAYSQRQSAIARNLAAAATRAEHAEKDARLEAQRAAEALEHELAVSRIEQGRLFGRTGNFRDAESLLWPAFLADPSATLPYHAMLELYLTQPCISTVRVHDAEVRAMARSADGSLFASGDLEGVIALWRDGGRTIVGRVESFGQDIRSLAFTGDMRHLFVGLDDGNIALVRVDDRQIVDRAAGHRGPVFTLVEVGTPRPSGPEDEPLENPADNAIATIPTGALRTTEILSTGADGRIVAWAIEGNRLVETWSQALDAGPVARMTRSPDGRLFATGHGNGVVQVWDLSALLETGTLREVRRLPGHAGSVSALAFQPGSDVLATGGVDRYVRFWRVTDGSLLNEERRPNGSVRGLVASTADQPIVSSGWWTYELWDPRWYTFDRSIAYPDGPNIALTGETPATLVTGHGEGRVRTWDLSATPLCTLARRFDGFASLRVRPGGDLIAVGDRSGAVHLLDPAGRERRSFREHTRGIGALAFSPDGALVAAAGLDGLLVLWDVETGDELARMTGVNAATGRALAFSPDGSNLLVTLNRAFRLLSVPALETLVDVDGSGESLSVAFAPDGETMALVSRRAPILHCRGDGTVIQSLPNVGATWTVDFSPDGSRLVGGTWIKLVRVWNLETGAIEAELPGHGALVFDVRCIPGDPTRVVSCGGEGEIRIWDLSSGRCLLTHKAFDGWEASAADLVGETLYASSAGGDVRAWDLAEGARRIAGNLESQLAITQALRPDDPRFAAALAWARRRLSPHEDASADPDAESADPRDP